MSVVIAVMGRNLRLFFRDRLNVFFSLLGAVILFALYTLFLGNLQTTGLAESLPGASEAEVQVFVDSWMFAGIVLGWIALVQIRRRSDPARPSGRRLAWGGIATSVLSLILAALLYLRAFG